MDVHRARFIPFPTPSVSCFAFTRTHDGAADRKHSALRLALARTNGSIEIWAPIAGTWSQETIFPPAPNVAVESLVWTQEPDEVATDGTLYAGQYRLFSIGSSAAVTEWNIQTGVVKRRSTGNFTEVWCMAAQPRSSKPSTYEQTTPSQDVVIGCRDGAVALLKTEDNDLQFKRFLILASKKKSRCLTVAYQKPNVVVAGFADSTIRVFDTRTATTIRIMNLGAGVPGAPKRALVWRLICLPNGDIVSGDSNGELIVWDGKTLSMTERLQGHDRDCLDVVASHNGHSFYSCGVDGRIASYKLAVSQGRTSWAKVSHRKISQQHGSVRALAAYDGDDFGVLIGAGSGPEANLVALKSFGKANFRTLPYLPQQPQAVSAPAARLLACWWQHTIHIYRVPPAYSLELLKDERNAAQQLVAKIQLDTDEHIRSVTLSADGSFITASTSTSIRAFQLASRSSSEDTLKIRKIKLPGDLAGEGARLLSVTAVDVEGLWLAAVTLDNEVRLTKVIWSPAQSDTLQCANHAIDLVRRSLSVSKSTGLSTYESNISKLAFSDDGAVLVVGDLSGRLDYFELRGDFDVQQGCIRKQRQKSASDNDSDSDDDDDDDQEIVLYGQTWQHGAHPLPRLPSAPLVMTFRPAGVQNLIDSQLDSSNTTTDCRLIVITADHRLYEYDVLQGRLGDYSRQNSDSILLDKSKSIRDRIMGTLWDPRERLWLYGSNFLCMLDLSDNMPSGSKRKRQLDDNKSNKRRKSSGAEPRTSNGPISSTSRKSLAPIEADKAPIADDEHSAELDLDRTEHDDPHEEVTGRRYWHTSKYQSILGIMPLGRLRRPSGEDGDVLEVVLVERPPENIKRKNQR